MTSQKTPLGFLLILSFLMAFTSLSTDIYLPAMPVMSQQLAGNAELTITGFLIGFAIAQLIWGPISDRIGRKIPLFIGLLLFIIGSVGCALAESMPSIVFWRVFQAVGACVAPMLSRTMIRDLYDKQQAARMLSTLMIIMAIAPIAGPFIGGGLLAVSSWHSIFWLLSGVGLLAFGLIFWLPETLPQEKRGSGALLTAFANYRQLLANRRYLIYTLSVTFYYVAAYAFITGSPFVYIEHFGVAPQHYGFLFGVNIVGIMGLSLINRQLVNRFALSRLLWVASLIATLAVLVGWLWISLNPQHIFAIILPVFVMFSTNGIIAACANAAALDSVPTSMAGSAAALLGALQYGSGILSSLLLAHFANGSPQVMMTIMLVFTALGALMAGVSGRKG